MTSPLIHIVRHTERLFFSGHEPVGGPSRATDQEITVAEPSTLGGSP